VRLSKRERDILARIGPHADKSLRELARISGHQIHSVRYLIERLTEAGALRRSWIVDPFQLGLQRFHVLFSTALEKPGTRAKLINVLKSSTSVSSFSELGGDFDFHINVLAPNVSGVMALLSETTEKVGPVLYAKELTIQTYVAYFPRKYMAAGSTKVQKLELGISGGKSNIDELDHQLLCELAVNPATTKQKLSERLQVSAVTIAARMKQLRQKKILIGATYVPSLSSIGTQNYRLLLHTRGVDNEMRKSILTWAAKEPHCTSVAAGLGGADFDLGIEVDNVERLIALKEELRHSYSSALSNLRVLSRLRVHKVMPYPFAPNEFERLYG
jgi:DNA-binding Lrp family transcriptional regulator